ncbi:MAG: hypothetical protein DMF61_03395 [Blastocatellia bacterium AA13]|nr:MAG: hypothetical protein DMF61_03395 [Blastocatellia bacterium AA13]
MRRADPIRQTLPAPRKIRRPLLATSSGRSEKICLAKELMESLVISNLLHRKVRTTVSIAGVALGVILVVLTVGIAHGFLSEQGRRNAAVTAEIIMRPPGSGFGLSLSPSLSMHVNLAAQIDSIEGVRTAVPVGQYLKGRMIDGINYADFTKVSDAHVVQGRAPEHDDEAIVDRFHETNNHAKLGDTITVADRQFHIVGIYEPESLARVKIPLAALQQISNRPGLCSIMLIQVVDPSKQEEVAERIKERFPDYGIWLTRDLPILYARGNPALQTFLKVVILLSVIVSSLVILLGMYTTVTERTRQIGVLKSLGASRGWIAGEIEKEALTITLLGVVVGFIVSLAGKYAITRMTQLNVELEASWLFYALGLGLLSGLIGAIYPALRAANQDPVKALAYE